MRKKFERIINIGTNSSFLPSEINLARKMNLISFVSIANMLVATVFFILIEQYSIVYACVSSFFLIPFVFILNSFKKYILSIYLYYFISFAFFLFLNFAWGIDSYIFLWFFPLIISMVQLLAKKETINHLVILSAFTLSVLITTSISYKYQFFEIVLNEDLIKKLFEFNLILSFTSTIVIIAIIAFENNSQEKKIKNMLIEKEILLAEVFHRVKNNLNIITSLINLKKNISESEEVKNALEECKNRIFSMALVHNNLITQNEIIRLDFKEYIKKLVHEITVSLGVEEKVEIVLLAEDVHLELTNSIPCGLILNELISNSYKYAQIETQKLQILIKLNIQNDFVELEVQDNGPGLSDEMINNIDSIDSLGMELIKSLSDQINGIYSFQNKNGLVFKLKFDSK
ncbi:MAG: sensor histidine kinase [Bacteroidota bacterium]